MLTAAALAPRGADDPGLDVTPEDILLLRNVGPRGYPRMPEGGNAASWKDLEAGTVDMVRTSDAHMSGTCTAPWR